jgi:BirA family biotin operon repressor/biotin-[acetyl-CoA-carboxylase] ligase
MLSKEKIEKLLEGAQVTVYKNIDSTNNEAKKRARNGEKMPQLICAESQSAGRGRLGRSFYSPDGTGLYMSLAFEVKTDMADALSVTSAAAVAAAEAIEELSEAKCLIKWVNDIYSGGRKVCGILAEAVLSEKRNIIIVGIGVNCTTADFPEDIKDRAGSIGKIDRNILAALISEKLLRYVKDLHSRCWMDDYRKRSMVLGKDITYTENGIARKAKAISIDDNGGLVVDDGEIRTLSTGEISIRF